MDKILVARIWEETDGGSGRSMDQIEVERGVDVPLMFGYLQSDNL
jgi:hypothetical protein